MYNALLALGDTTPTLDVSGITSTVSVSAVLDVITCVFPIVAIAIMTGIVFYVVKWAIRLFRGI